ncbi:MAG: hypothetical protein ACI4EX_10485 [Lachnospiraceae bacterium]
MEGAADGEVGFVVDGVVAFVVSGVVAFVAEVAGTVVGGTVVEVPDWVPDFLA